MSTSRARSLALPVLALLLAPQAAQAGLFTKQVRIHVLGVQVSETRSDGTSWDGPDKSTNDAVGASALPLLALGQVQGAVAALVGGSALNGIAPPDLQGTALVVSNAGLPLSTINLPLVDDDITPSYCASDTACPHSEVHRLGDITALTVTLVDDDALDDDAILPVTLSRKDLRRLMRTGQNPFTTTDQGQGEIQQVSLIVERVR